MSQTNNVDGHLVLERILDELNSQLEPAGFEISPFLAKWYNDIVNPRLRLDEKSALYDDSVGICIISIPQMFEKTFLRYINEWSKGGGISSLQNSLKNLKYEFKNYQFTPGQNDPFDWSVFLTLQNALKTTISKLKVCSELVETDVLDMAHWIPDFAIKPITRFPYIHVQSVGHVSGLAYFHQIRKELTSAENKNRIYGGCSLHPYYGGWFGFRGVYVFPKLRCPNLSKREPISPLSSVHLLVDENLLNKLLYEYNENWCENRWRNFQIEDLSKSSKSKRYSDKAELYFSTKPSERFKLIDQWIHCFNSNNHCHNNDFNHVALL